VVPHPLDWDASRLITGYWFLDVPQDPPQKLVEFLSTGPAPVYIGFGSTIARDAPRLARLAIEALERSGQRGVLAARRGGLALEELPASVCAVEAVPHRWLFPQMSAVVHHGGAGTTAAGLRAGVPNIVVPFTSDQPFWGWRVERLGAGPRPIPINRLTAAILAEAITIALNDQEMRRKASELGARIRNEDGVARAVAYIEAYFSRAQL
jgi:sterol 3beta-glucosyltransferase